MNWRKIASSAQRMSDERLDRLGTYFIYFDIAERLNITFEEWIRTVDSGRWAEMMR